MSEKELLARPLSPATIPAGGLTVAVTPTAAERAAIVGAFGLVDLPLLEATLELQRAGDRVDITGVLKAEAVQSCVVSLEPVRETIHDSFQRCFVREDKRPPSLEDIDPLAEDPPDIYAETIDIGLVVLEEFALALDPYPRAPGVVFEPPVDEEDPGPDSPFAALKSLGHRRPT